MPPYQDSITALMGAPTTSDEERMAMSLRNDRTAGNLLGLSTIDQVSNLGTGMTKNTMVAAKQAGALNQAREKAALDREQRAETQAATNDYRASVLAQAQARAAALEKNRALLEQNRLRDDERRRVKEAADLDIKRKKFNINSHKNNHVVNNLGGFLGQEAAVIRANQLAGVETVLDPNAPPPEARIAEWSAINGGDENFTNQLIKDVGDLNIVTGMSLTDAVILGGENAYDWAKYQHSLTGRTGIMPYTQKQNKIPRGLIDEQDTISKNLEDMISQMDAYEPSFASETLFPRGNTIANYFAKEGYGSVDRKQEGAWHGNLNQFYTMPERHKYFGAALSPTEQADWEKSAINPNMDDYQIRHAMATRLYIMRQHAEKQIKSGLSSGYSMNVIKDKYDFLTNTTVGNLNPDTPEGDRLLRAGWYPGDDPADYPADAEGNSETGTDTSIFTDEDQAEIDAINARMAGKVL